MLLHCKGQFSGKKNNWFLLLASDVSLPVPQHTDDEDKIDFGGGNVHVITSKEEWDQKIEEANKDGKIVSKTYSRSQEKT
jgi:hypothetical protein